MLINSPFTMDFFTTAFYLCCCCAAGFLFAQDSHDSNIVKNSIAFIVCMYLSIYRLEDFFNWVLLKVEI